MNILDTNVFNRLLDGRLTVDDLPAGRYVVTHIQRDELDKTPDEARRLALQAWFDSVVDDLVATESFVLDVSRLDEAKLGDGVILEEIRTILSSAAPDRFGPNTNDALIGETAINNGYVLVTADAVFAFAVRTLGGDVIEIE